MAASAQSQRGVVLKTTNSSSSELGANGKWLSNAIAGDLFLGRSSLFTSILYLGMICVPMTLRGWRKSLLSCLTPGLIKVINNIILVPCLIFTSVKLVLSILRL